MDPAIFRPAIERPFRNGRKSPFGHPMSYEFILIWFRPNIFGDLLIADSNSVTSAHLDWLPWRVVVSTADSRLESMRCNRDGSNKVVLATAVWNRLHCRRRYFRSSFASSFKQNKSFAASYGYVGRSSHLSSNWTSSNPSLQRSKSLERCVHGLTRSASRI